MLYDRDIETAWGLYTSLVDLVAEKHFREIIEPFCERRGFTFLAGNGAWFIGPPHAHSWHPEDFQGDKEWQAVADLLNMRVPGIPANDLGSLMPSYEEVKR